ncbi:hypothetical protein H0H92_003487 [Tricholoma furcatifolium]|nr:hypothetical protein H0H92_003487 [Tricholoma furcatifolium]
MGSLEEFESILKDVVQAKRLSASKMSKMTDIAMKSMEVRSPMVFWNVASRLLDIQNDTQLVSILYRTHKALPPSAKVPSLYVFDALSRAAKSHVNKHGTSGTDATQGNCSTFLSKIEGVLDGLVQDMMTVESSEAKEKTRKVLDIWVKGNTFPSEILTRLSSLVKETEKVSEVPISSIPTDPRIASAQPSTITSPKPIINAAPPAPDPQATLLALLAQAAQTAAVPTQTIANTSVTPGLDAQLAVLQQLALAQTANNGSPSQPVLQQTVSAQSHSAFPTTSYREEPSYYSHKDPRLNGPQSSERVNVYESQPEDRSSLRSGSRGGFRGRGRGRWDDRDRDRYRERDERDSSPRRIKRSRSRSPLPHGSRRNVRPYSPPRRPNFASIEHDPAKEDPGQIDTHNLKDEFGRDIRPHSPDNNPPPSKLETPPSLRPSSPTPPPAPPTSQTTETVGNASSALTSNNEQMSLSPSIAANTSSSVPSASIVTNTVSSQSGLESFNPLTFDFTSPKSWEVLGEMWQVTNGYLPSTEELGQFVMSTTMASMASNVPAWQTMPTNHNQQWSAGGRGRGGFARGRGGFSGNGRNVQQEWGQYEMNHQDTDAVVLGQSTNSGSQGDKMHNDGSSTNLTQVNTGGKMQRVGDKWMFVREPVSTR